MNINKKLKAKLYQIHYKLPPLINIISGLWTMLLDPCNNYKYFCIKMIFSDFLKVKKKLWKYAPNCTIKNFFIREACPRTPLANAWLCHVSQPPPPPNNSCPPWQILHTPMNYYWEIYLRIHPGRQFIVCSTLYVYALQNIFRGQKLTKIVAQHILKCITWALFSNTMCP